MEMIDRYVQAVTERLPEDTREDVARELHANIEDMQRLCEMPAPVHRKAGRDALMNGRICFQGCSIGNKGTQYRRIYRKELFAGNAPCHYRQ